MDDPHGRVNGHRAPGPERDRGKGPLLASRERYPRRPASTREAVAALLDEAHASLSTQDLAALLLAVRRMTGDADGLMQAPAGGLALSRGPGVADYLGRITGALAAEPAGDGLGRWLEGYLDEVAARPRGSALRQAA